MNVNKFGGNDRTEVIENHVTLADLNNNFLRRDGANTAIGSIDMSGNTLTNVSNPVSDHDVATKEYVDQNALKTGDTMTGNLEMGGNRITGLPTAMPASDSDAVSWLQVVSLTRDAQSAAEGMNTKLDRSGDTMIGDLQLSVGDDPVRLLGCTDLTEGHGFRIDLGNRLNAIRFFIRSPPYDKIPVRLDTQYGFVVSANGVDVCHLGTANERRLILIYRNILMNSNRILLLPEPIRENEPATKNYVDNNARKILNGYVPLLTPRTNANTTITGFVATASHQHGNHYRAVNVFNGKYVPGEGRGGEWATREVNRDFWIQIQCPDLVRIWRVDLRGRDSDGHKIYNWEIQGSTNGHDFTTILTPQNPSYLGNTVKKFLIDTAERFNYYRLYCHEAEGAYPGLSYMQLFIYSE